MLRIESVVTACQCACDHCLACGNKKHFNMSIDDIEFILKNMKNYSDSGFFFPLYDVTNHPEFIEILKLSNSYGFKRNLLSVNGVHEFTNRELASMKDIGIEEIQLAFHGIGDTHDKFVHFDGAYKRLLSLIERAGKYGFTFWIILFVHKENIIEIQPLLDRLKQIQYIRSEDVGLTTYQYMGRAVKLKNLQFTRDEFERLQYKDKVAPKKRFTEREWLEIVRLEDWNRPVFIYDKSNLDLHIDKKFNVFFRTYNPYSLPGLPNSEAGFKLGNLKEDSLVNIIHRLEDERPFYIKTLENIMVPELADIVGESEDVLYTFNDIPEYKWPLEFLKRQIL